MLITKHRLLNTLNLSTALTGSLIIAGSLILSACGGDANSSGDTTAPVISHVSPNNNAVAHSRKVIITGQAIDDIEVKSVIVINREQTVIATLSENTFSATLAAIPGQNTYSVTVTDTSNNETTSEASFYFGSQASAGGAHSGIIKDQRIYAWGRNNKGQTGIGAFTKLNDDPVTATASHPIVPTLISVPSDTINAENGHREETKFVSLAFNQNASSALDSNGQVWSWGDGKSGQLGLGITDDNLIDDTNYTSPQKISGLANVVAISRGGAHALLLTSDGTVLAFGNNRFGQLGDGSNISQDSPVAVQGLTNIVQISASSTSYALDEAGRLWAWGNNEYGQLVTGGTDSDVHSTPTEITMDEPLISIASGNHHVLALTNSGKVYAWGKNTSSQIGMRPRDQNSVSEIWDEDIITPKLLPWFDDAIAVWAKGNQSFVQRRDGKIYPWGQNMLGTLGIESDANITQPSSPILELGKATDLGNGALHTLAIRNDGSLFSWGWSFEGSLGGGENMINRWSYKLPVLLSLPKN